MTTNIDAVDGVLQCLCPIQGLLGLQVNLGDISGLQPVYVKALLVDIDSLATEHIAAAIYRT